MKTAILVIDVQSGSFTPSLQRGFEGMAVEDQESYLQSLDRTLSKFREQGSDVIWATIGEEERFVAPVNHSRDVRSEGQLKDMGWYGGPSPIDDKTQQQLQSFQDITRKIGPRKCDAAVMKMGFNTFNPGKNSGRDLLKHLKRNEIDHLVIVGGNAEVCVTATALGASQNGFKVTVLSDHLLSDDKIIDNGGTKRFKPSLEYETEMKGRLKKFAAGMTEAESPLSADKLREEGISIGSSQLARNIRNIHIQTSSAYFEPTTHDPLKGYRGKKAMVHGKTGPKTSVIATNLLTKKPHPNRGRPTYKI